jgi:hypothetical protein
MFKYKTDAEVQAMTEQEANDYAVVKRAHEADLQTKAIDSAVKGAKEALQAELKKANEDVTELALKVTQMESKGSEGSSLEGQLRKALEENHEAIKNIAKAGSGMVEITLKAVGDITTGNGVNTSPPNITGTQQSPLSNVNYRNFDVTPLTTNISTSLAAYPYTEAKPKDGDYAFLLEGAIKPQVDFSWETNYAKPVKAAAWVRLTDESVQDIAGLESVARDLLFKKHNIKKAKGILYGDGISPNPKGATTYGRVFSAGALALSVTQPNFMDVVNAAITDIATTHNYEDEMPYMANLVLVNPNDFFIQLVSAKDLNGLPLYPTASLFNTVVIGGVTIMPEETIPAGKIFVCDMSRYNTTNYLPYTVKIGYVNDDFIKNQFVILGESRFHAFVKKLDEQAFIYDDIATIKAAITKA